MSDDPVVFIYLNVQQYGDIHTLYTACKNHGFVMISYYDIRAARNAMKALQNKLMRHKKLSIHYSSPNVSFMYKCTFLGSFYDNVSHVV